MTRRLIVAHPIVVAAGVFCLAALPTFILADAPGTQPAEATDDSRQLARVEVQLAAALSMHDPASFDYLQRTYEGLTEGQVAALINAFPQKFRGLVLSNHKAGVTRENPAAGLSPPTEIPITSRNVVGYAVGRVNRGDSLILEYVTGKWKSYGRVATESPDSLKPTRGDTCRVAICDMGNNDALGRVLEVVPGGTRGSPFLWTSDRDYEQVALRINSEDADFSRHPDKGVKYRLWIVPAGLLDIPEAAAGPEPESVAYPLNGQGVPDQSSFEGQLQQLLSPIALYPDPLLAEVLTASTYPQQIQEAVQWLQANSTPTQGAIDAQPWDSSVKALIHYPSALQYMAANMAWTESLGSAFTSNQSAVNATIQDLREQAVAVGSLRSTTQQTVLEQDGTIHVEPGNPDDIYVPTYDPAVVYIQPTLIVFSEHYVVGPWMTLGFDWANYLVFVGDWHTGWIWDHHHWFWHIHWRHKMYYWARSVRWGSAPHVTHFAVHAAFRGRAFRTVPVKHAAVKMHEKK